MTTPWNFSPGGRAAAAVSPAAAAENPAAAAENPAAAAENPAAADLSLGVEVGTNRAGEAQSREEEGESLVLCLNTAISIHDTFN